LFRYRVNWMDMSQAPAQVQDSLRLPGKYSEPIQEVRRTHSLPDRFRCTLGAKIIKISLKVIDDNMRIIFFLKKNLPA